MSDVIASRLQETGVVAIIRGIDTSVIHPLVQALYDGGIRLVEVTLNTEGALEAIASLLSKFGDSMSVGAGTVLNEQQALAAKAHGAQFFVTPNVDRSVIHVGVEANIPVMAGALTPTEIYDAYSAGAQFVKVFPAGTMGARYIKEVRGPLANVPLMAVGGVTLENAGEFFDAGVLALGLGGSLVNKAAVERGDYDAIREMARSFVDLYRTHRG
ncbi:bifunctional 4-hydroxy-2-oxoglutarate aldolase/2-dehydro-3-deoxy-phosphogluconate aldolase [Alicyclobacillus fastidiosus]|uniref:Bifunctional 4-hydroxy-2-oxoglutarate aldolase/2-dehydro-3-deoxy-phosphogluconate aldolase n=1 Tax=Alicyclobacillus fastidiosus TaxID=392011 RepID=A0ABY6ZF92_9BACL|nr:bifunctional 4-hydroxy-2-oxoglutarate aldolase/2-dehydro-3-deoxy-phosphogluconate aldolase [Alicyclobacillus fastidiosus]WAH41167.1 bifunctional 4-hydroxy-2-oxoglutarate aldolase/2-dehydro-3-deoxy-phosphogluconate aldolase [Alicyclobacillus fastidiosus]GMA62742.1 2-dehydro-3-deoxy-phosphogluconate aldolase [Alicyclobacillus fastidiosus]